MNSASRDPLSETLYGKGDAVDDVSLVDFIRSALNFIQSRRQALVLIFTLGVVGGLIAGFAFNPVLIEARIKNDGFFDLPTFRALQVSLADPSTAITHPNFDEATRERVRLKFRTQNWIQSNITPEFSISKTDLKSSTLPDKAADAVGQTSTLAFIKITSAHVNADNALSDVRLMAALCIDINLRSKAIQVLNEGFNRQTAEIQALSQAVPGALLGLEATEKNLALLKGVKSAYPDDFAAQKVAQLQISNMVGNGADQTKFLPLDTQLTGFEIEAGSRRAELDQIRFRQKAAQRFYTQILHALDLVKAGKDFGASMSELVRPAFWQMSLGAEAAPDDQDFVNSDYYNKLVDPLRLEIEALKRHADLIASQPLLIDQRPSFSRVLSLLAGVGFALLVSFGLFGIDTISRRLREAG